MLTPQTSPFPVFDAAKDGNTFVFILRVAAEIRAERMACAEARAVIREIGRRSRQKAQA